MSSHKYHFALKAVAVITAVMFSASAVAKGAIERTADSPAVDFEQLLSLEFALSAVLPGKATLSEPAAIAGKAGVKGEAGLNGDVRNNLPTQADVPEVCGKFLRCSGD